MFVRMSKICDDVRRSVTAVSGLLSECWVFKKKEKKKKFAIVLHDVYMYLYIRI